MRSHPVVSTMLNGRFVKPGAAVRQFEPLCEVQSDKAAVEITSRYDGVIKKLHYDVGEMAKVGYPLVEIETQDEAKGETTAKEEIKQEVKEEIRQEIKGFVDNSGKILATPAVRRIAREHSVDISRVHGTGKSGRVTKEDILAFISQPSQPTQVSQVKEVPAVVAAEDRIVPLTMIQKAMFKEMTRSLSIPHFGFSEEINVARCSQFRDEINNYVAKNKGKFPFAKISYMPIFIKSLSLALKEFPILNAEVMGDSLKYRSAHNVGVAMDTPAGLLVPNIKNVETKSVLEVAAELHRLQNMGSNGAFTQKEISGGTITLSNVGMIGGINLNPVLVTREVCIGAVGRIRTVPQWENNQWVPRKVAMVSFSADHRVIDGATLARFVVLWKEHLQSPFQMLGIMK